MNLTDNTPKVLVAIKCLTYNHEPYIRDALEGFVMQKTNFRFVAIVHDDASTDGTANIVRQYAEKYPDIIKPIFETENQYSKKNSSLTKIMAKALEATGAKYIAMCEGDDYWTDPHKLQKQVDFLEANPDYGMCYTNFDLKNEVTGKYTIKAFDTLPQIFQKEFNSVEEFILRKGYVCPPSWLFRKELMPKTTFGSLDGTFVYFTQFLVNTKVKYLSDSTAVYRILKESASHTSNSQKAYQRAVNLLETQEILIKRYNLRASLIDRCKYNFYSSSLAFFVANRFRKDVKVAKKILPQNILRNKLLFLANDLRLWWLVKLSYKFKVKKF